jgi:hypothetical protein
MTLMALLFFLILTNKGILGMMGLKTLSFSKGQEPPQSNFNMAPDGAVSARN